MANPQTFKNHTRFDPAFHLFVVPLLIANLIITIFVTARHWSQHNLTHIWLIVMALVLLALTGVVRASALKVQNRVIRLEERLRLISLVSPPESAHIHELTTRQLIALRFASDAEIPTLVHKTLTQNLEPNAIKESIVNWRPDYERV